MKLLSFPCCSSPCLGILFLAFFLVSCDSIIVPDYPRGVKYMEGLSLDVPSLLQGRKRSSSVSISFFAHSRQFNLLVEPYSGWFHPHAQFSYVGSNGTEEKVEIDVGMYYKGVVLGEGKSDVALSLEHERNLITGLIRTANESYSLEAAHRYISPNKKTPYNMVIYRWGDVEFEGHCGVEDSPSEQEMKRSSLAHATMNLVERQSFPKTCYVSAVGDSWWYAHWQSVYDSTKAMIDAIVGSDILYRNQVNNGLSCVRTLVYTNPGSDPYRTVASSGISQFLSELRTRRNDAINWPPTTKLSSTRRCVIHGFTYQNYGGTLGLAYKPAICGSSGAGVTTGFGLSANQLLMTVAHEIGHNFGCDHDPSSSCSDPQANRRTVMAACSFGSSELFPFSSFSVGQIQSTVTSRGGCLEDRNQRGYCGNGWIEASEGEQCDCGNDCASDPLCNDACQLQGGAVCSPSGGTCCTETGQFRSKGTVCGSAKYSWLPAPTCTGSSAECPSCWPDSETHWCDRYSNIEPCESPSGPCKTACQLNGNPGSCSSNWVGLESNLPDGVCCPGGICNNGVCDTSQCTPTTCAAQGYECGSLPDGCGDTLQCGSCPSGSTCSNGKCNCVPNSNPCSGKSCGTVSDGCKDVSCGTCSGGSTCINFQCSCVPDPNACSARECGTVWDGCSNVVCGTCDSGFTCSNGFCTCVPSKTCASEAAECGFINDGCKTVDCGSCTGTNEACSQGKCVCQPKTCSELGAECGSIDDGCGNLLSCGGCGTNKECKNNVCVDQACNPISCASAGRECGNFNNNCNIVSCGTCTAPDTCNLQGKCECIPTKTCSSEGQTCGILFDGCKEILCGNCDDPFVCKNGMCACDPITSCAQAGAQCGKLYDGCQEVDCGNCDPGVTCVLRNATGLGGICDVPCTQPTTTCLDEDRECGKLFNGCTNINCGTCSDGEDCVQGTCVNIISSNQTVISSKKKEDSSTDLAISLGISIPLAVIILIVTGAVAFYVYRRKKARTDTPYTPQPNLVEYEDSSLNVALIGSPQFNNPSTAPSAPPPTISKPPVPVPSKNLPPAPSKNLPPPPVNKSEFRKSRKLAAPPTGINQDEFKRRVPGALPHPAPGGGRTLPPRPAPGGGRNLPPRPASPGKNLPPRPAPGGGRNLPPRPPNKRVSVMVGRGPPPAHLAKRQVNVPKVGATVQAKYSQDGYYYRAVVDDVQNGHALVRYIDHGEDQEWVPFSSVKQ